MSKVVSPQEISNTGPVDGTLLIESEIESLVSGRGNKVLQQCLETIRNTRKTGDKKKIGRAVLDLAVEMRSQGQYANTVQVLEKVRVLFESIGDEAGLASTFEELALSSRELSRNALALEYSHQAIRLLKKLDMVKELGQAYDNLSYIYFYLSKRHESLTFGKKARAIFREYKMEKDLAWNSCNLAMIYLDMDFFQQAEKYYSEAVQIFTDLKMNHGLAWSLLGLATVHRAMCKFESCLRIIAKGETIEKEHQPKDYTGWMALNQAAIYRSQGKGEESLNRNKWAVNLFSSIKNQVGVAWGLFQVGQIFRDRGMLVKSWQAFGRTVDIFQDVSNRKGSSWAQNEWGLTHLELNNLGNARDCFAKALDGAEQLNITGLRAEVHKNLANLHIDEGRVQKAGEMIDKAHRYQKKLETWESYPDLLLAQARQLIQTDQFVKAKSCLKAADAFVQEHKLERLNPTLKVYKAEVQFGLGDVQGAIRTWMQALEEASTYHQIKPRIDALFGLVQAQWKTKSPSQLSSILAQLEKDLRVAGSRKLRAKYLLVKGLLAYHSKGTVETRLFAQSLRLLEITGLSLLQYNALEMLIQIYGFLKKDREKEKCRKEIQFLVSKNSIDPYFLRAHPRPLEGLPISVVL